MRKDNELMEEGYKRGVEDALNVIKRVLGESEEEPAPVDNIDEKTFKDAVNLDTLCGESESLL